MPEIKEGLGKEFGYLAGWFVETNEVRNWKLTKSEGLMLHKFVEVAQRIIPAVAEFPESIMENRKGATVVISRPEDNIPPVAIAINEEYIPDNEFGTKSNKHLIYALSKAMFAMQYKGAYGSRNNTGKWLNNEEEMIYVKESPIPAGSFSYRGWVVAVSGFNPPEIDEATAIAIHVGAGNMPIRVAEEFAKDIPNRDYLERMDDYLEPIYH